MLFVVNIAYKAIPTIKDLQLMAKAVLRWQRKTTGISLP
jgi:hypothetical protein